MENPSKLTSVFGKIEPIVALWQSRSVYAVGKTHIGMVRDSNQDSYCINEQTGLFLVADGMGGRAGGEVASQLAVEVIQEEVSNRLESLLSRELSARRMNLSQTINTASLKIYERSLELPQYRGMGTTCTLVWIPPPREPTPKYATTAIVAHVGDSRCYLLRAGLLYQVTDDHSLVNEQLKAGALQRDDPLVNQMKNVITRCVGYQEEEEVDTFLIPLHKGDCFLLCSDGLTNKVTDLELARYMGANDLNNGASDLINLANANGGEDNITVLLVRVP